MEPSNFRYNPYDDIPTGVEITERHIIPANSPYYIRLNEVPQKTSPSTMQVKEITSVGTSVTYGQTFNEVAATPAAGEFWPDCNTGANGDENWNTGLIAFNAADAGKIIEVTYTGTGTLAGVNSNHWPSWYTDRGDGSDGDFVPTGNVTISGVKNYKSVFIKEGVTVTCSSNTWIKCQGAFLNEGTINMMPSGAYGGEGIDDNNNGQDGMSSGIYGASGGAGGRSDYDYGRNGGAGGSSLTKENLPYPMLIVGSGGGSGSGSSSAKSGKGGRGGGSISITAQILINKGEIFAKGENGFIASSTNHYAAGGGGGGGGSILAVSNFLVKGTMDASGGIKGTGYDGGYDGADGSEGLIFTKELGVI